MYPLPVGKFTRAGTLTLLVVWAMPGFVEKDHLSFQSMSKICLFLTRELISQFFLFFGS